MSIPDRSREDADACQSAPAERYRGQGATTSADARSEHRVHKRDKRVHCMLIEQVLNSVIFAIPTHTLVPDSHNGTPSQRFMVDYKWQSNMHLNLVDMASTSGTRK